MPGVLKEVSILATGYAPQQGMPRRHPPSSDNSDGGPTLMSFISVIIHIDVQLGGSWTRWGGWMLMLMMVVMELVDHGYIRVQERGQLVDS